MKGGRIRRLGAPQELTDAARLIDVRDAISKVKSVAMGGGMFPSGGGGAGARGPQGAEGGAGNGSQGAQGNQGLTGSGAQGNQGFAGVQGNQGNQGVPGTGAQGNQGLAGPQGNQGFQGIDGTTGAQGNQGFQGFQGFQGITGAQGNQGFQGLQGFQGFQGAQGNQGIQGFQGIDGSVATLDSAYDGGGAGAGRTITVDAGPVQLTGAGAPATPGLQTWNGTQSITSAAGATWKALYVTPDVTVTGATSITTAAGFNMIEIDAPTISSASALTILTSASLYIAGPPVGGGAGPATITNAWSIRVDSGNVVFEGAANVGSVTEAVDPGDFSVGLTGANRMTYDQSTGRYAMYSGAVKTIELNATGAALSDPLIFVDAQAFESGILLQGTNYPALTIRSSTTSGGQLILQSKTSVSATLYRWSWYVEGDNLHVWNGTLGDVAYWFLASGSLALNDATFRTVRFNSSDSTNPQIRASYDGTNFGQFTATSVGALQIDTSGVAGVIFNEAGADRDLRAEGDSLSHLFFLDATATTENAAFFATAAPGWNTMDRGFFIGDAETTPTGNPTAGGYLYSSAGAGTWRGSGGTTTAFGPAGPHCGKCGYDAWTVACFNDKWESWDYECGHCGEHYQGGPKNVMKRLSAKQKKEIITHEMEWDEIYAIVAGKN